MALRLVVEGRVVEAGGAYCSPDVAPVPAPVRERREVGFVPTRNVVAAYLDKGVIRPEQARAAEEIAQHWYSVTRALHARTGRYGERVSAGKPGADSPAEAARTGRYLAWAGWAGLHGIGAVTLVDVTLDVAVDGLSWRGVREKRGIGNDRAKRLVQTSLWQYALLAGWVEARLAKAA